MSLRELHSWLRGLADAFKPPVPHGIVIDTGDDTLVAIGIFAPALIFLNESMMDTSYEPDIVSADTPRILRSGPRSYPEWSWDYSQRKFKKTNPSIITEDARECAILAAKKVEAISWVIYSINRHRTKIYTGLYFQDHIYAEKERQALRLKDGGFDERLATEAPYVVQYASDSGISLRQASEEILLQAKLDHEYLAKTEKTRLALFKKIRLAKTSEEVEETISNFRKTGSI